MKKRILSLAALVAMSATATPLLNGVHRGEAPSTGDRTGGACEARFSRFGTVEADGMLRGVVNGIAVTADYDPASGDFSCAKLTGYQSFGDPRYGESDEWTVTVRLNQDCSAPLMVRVVARVDGRRTDEICYFQP